MLPSLLRMLCVLQAERLGSMLLCVLRVYELAAQFQASAEAVIQ